MTEPIFPVSLQLRLDWSEMDLYGHINNVAYFKYLQASRVNYWERAGMNSRERGAGIGPALASTKCDFRKPLYYPGQITVRASITEIRRTSFSLVHQILNTDGDLAAEGYDVVVLFDYVQGIKKPISPELRARFEELEGKSFPIV